MASCKTSHAKWSCILALLVLPSLVTAQRGAAFSQQGPFAGIDRPASSTQRTYRHVVGAATHRLLRSIDQTANRLSDPARQNLSPADQEYAENMRLGEDQPTDVDENEEPEDTDQSAHPQYPSPQQRKWNMEELNHDRRVEAREARRLRWHQRLAPRDDDDHGPEAAVRRSPSTRQRRWHRDRRRFHAHRRIARIESGRSRHPSRRVQQVRRRRQRMHQHRKETAVQKALRQAGSVARTQQAGVDAVDAALQAHSESNARNEELETRVAERLRRKGQRLRDVAESMRDKRSELRQSASSLDEQASEDTSEAKQTQSEAVDLLAKLLTPKRTRDNRHQHYLSRLAEDQPTETAEKALKHDRRVARAVEVKYANAAVQTSHLLNKHKGISQALNAKMKSLKRRVIKARTKVADDQAALNNLASPYTKTTKQLSAKMSSRHSNSLQSRAARRTARAKQLLRRARQLRAHASSLRAKAKSDKSTHNTLMEAAHCLERQADRFESDNPIVGDVHTQAMYHSSLQKCGLAFRTEHGSETDAG